MKKSIRILCISLLQLLTILLSVSTAYTTKPLGFHMEIQEVILSGEETFYTSSPAEDQGLICSQGITHDVYSNTFGPPRGDYRYANIVNSYACNDGSGAFS